MNAVFEELRDQAEEIARSRGLAVAGVVERVLSRDGRVRSGRIAELRRGLDSLDLSDIKVVVLGGGTGLSNLIGGDSRGRNWWQNPFSGLKELFPSTSAVVCVTDDGGSTGMISSRLPVIALGDLRHVILAAVRAGQIRDMGSADPHRAAARLHRIINHRLDAAPSGPVDLLGGPGGLADLPGPMAQGLSALGERLFADPRLVPLLEPGNCVGNLLLAAAIVAAAGEGDISEAAVYAGVAEFSRLIGAGPVFPCAGVPAALRFSYANGVEVTGEYKSALARRRVPVAGVSVCFANEPALNSELAAAIAAADLIVFAPGSLYSSVIPVLQTPGIAAAIRANRRAVKVLVANIWVQAGETDLVYGDPARRFHVSDLILAYDLNIPGGVQGLFDQVLCLGLREIPGSVLSRYGVEGKVPIYLDRNRVIELGFTPVEAAIHSTAAMAESGVIQHDPAAVARALKTLYVLAGPARAEESRANPDLKVRITIDPDSEQSGRMARMRGILAGFGLSGPRHDVILDVLARHRDIPAEHFGLVRAVACVPPSRWRRDQAWDRLFSFYDPETMTINLREDVTAPGPDLELAFLAALGQSLLGNYALDKRLEPVRIGGVCAGRVFTLKLRPENERRCWFSPDDLDAYLRLARMCPQGDGVYTRLINDDEGFTPPGMLFGLVYAWYLDNRLAGHIEYKMEILRQPVSSLVPEQVRTAGRRRGMVAFFREKVFVLGGESRWLELYG